MQPARPDTWGIITLSFRQTFHRLAFWILPNLWAVLLSIPIITWPAAKSALYKTIADGLCDPFAIRIKTRQVFRQAFFFYLKKSLLLSLVNLLVFFIIIFAVFFWVTQEQPVLNFLAIISLYFLAVWWFCQPFLFPMMVELPSLSIIQLIRQTLGLISHYPLQAFITTFVTTLITILGLVLMGPALLLTPSLAALISIQTYWIMTGKDIPDFIDPVEYEDRMSTPLMGKEKFH